MLLNEGRATIRFLRRPPIIGSISIGLKHARTATAWRFGLIVSCPRASISFVFRGMGVPFPARSIRSTCVMPNTFRASDPFVGGSGRPASSLASWTSRPPGRAYGGLKRSRSGLVASAEDCAWSSARAHVSGSPDPVLKHPCALDLSIQHWRCFLSEREDAARLSRIFERLKTGRPAGDIEFTRHLA